MNSALIKGDITTLRTLQIQIHYDMRYNIFTCCSDERESCLDEDNEIVKSISNRTMNLLSSSAVSVVTDDTKLYFGTKKGEFGKIERLNSQENQNVDLIELFSSDFNRNNSIISVATPRNGTFSDVAFALDQYGSLHIVCSFSLLELFVWNEEKVLNFVLYEEHEHLNILMVTERQNDTNQEVLHTLQIREYPTFHLIYELKVNSFCKPMVSSSGQESLLIIEGSFCAENQSDEANNVLTSLRIRGICEGNPEIRLGRLLRRNKFEDAEVLAKVNRLDFE